jgi:hypothetical protein
VMEGAKRAVARSATRYIQAIRGEG